MDPIAIARQVEERYRRYLETTFYFRDPDFRASFREALRGEGLSKGPYIEGTPVYRRTETTAKVVREVLGADPDPGFLKGLSGERVLYRHQEEAIRRAGLGRNLIVATGTGSGKTETFLYPILLSLYREFLQGTLGPGVRALLLYPMNALANDQRERLGQIARALKEAGSPFNFTFGQYTGETPEDDRDRERNAAWRARERLEGEQIFRNQMRAAPPHILLTNYSMLEYLLTRPKDSDLFDNSRARHWRFIVLDEVHQYRGAEGAEMALLLRRLKRRLREGGRTGPFQCIATSATLADREEDRAEAASFAANLFGEPFETEDVLQPQTVPVEDLPASLEGQLDPRTQELRRLVTGKQVPVAAVTERLFPEWEPGAGAQRLAELAEQLVQTTDPRSGAPLLSTRFHLFLRALEGAYVQFWPTRRVLIDSKGAEGPVFEVALCRECGQHYLVAPRGFTGGKITAPVRDPGQEAFGVTFLREVSAEAQEIRGLEADDEGAAEGKPVRPDWELCIRCGVAQRPGQLQPGANCGHEGRILLVAAPEPPDEERSDQAVRCGACGYRGQDPVREVVHGTDGPHAVIGTTLIRSLPEGQQKVLAFVDGRQEAAFYAWYLERSYADLVTRNLFYRTLQRLQAPQPAAEGLSPSDLVDELVPVLRKVGVFPASASPTEVRRNVWTRVYRELLDMGRTSLEGVALARWEVKLPDWYDLTWLQRACPVSVDLPSLRGLVAQVLDTVRADRAVELATDGGSELTWDVLELQGVHHVLDLARSGRKAGRVPATVKTWDDERGRRVGFLGRWLSQRGVPEDQTTDSAKRFLRAMWEWVVISDGKAGRSEDRLFRETCRARLRLNPRWIRLHLVREDDMVYRCRLCARLYPRSVDGLCPRYGCGGTLEPVPLGELEPDHYRELYREPGLVGPMRVEEHTAQLASQTASEYQKAFQKGDIQLLSSSTTFELGVDLGDLHAIFLRNVPPEASNYAQRVGRAGRRSGRPGLAITYCRRTPHDLYHFRVPERLMRGETRPPVLHLDNEKIILRHMTATVLSHFFRVPENRGRFDDVRSLVGDFENPSLVEAVSAHVGRARTALEASLKAIVPESAWDNCGLKDGSWAERVIGPKSRLALAEATVTADWISLRRFEEEASAAGEYGDASWAKRRRRTVEKEEVLSFLSRQVVIPKYGFPVDVVTLETLGDSEDAGKVELQRDLRLAIAEFAPGARVVANKKEWISYGLKRAPSRDREWQRRSYRHCPKCNTFDQWGPGEAEPPRRCSHSPHEGDYVVPEFGFVTGREAPKEPRGRQPRLFTTRPYFAGSVGHVPQEIPIPARGRDPVLLLRPASPGRLVVLCEGRRGKRFWICPGCGAGFATRPDGEHTDPFGRPCRGLPERVSLGHEFETDVVGLRFLHVGPWGGGGAELAAGAVRIPRVGAAAAEEVASAAELASAAGLVAAREALSFSVAYALVEGAALVLGAPPRDLNVTVTAGDSIGAWPIVLYDDVPGGAGLVERLQNPEVLRDVLKAAVERTDGSCGCKEDESCYGCLRSYRNQFIQHRLNRGLANEYLRRVLRAV